jgi:hypothetical protein
MEEIWNYHPDIRHLKMDTHQGRESLEDTWIALLS